LSEAISVGHFGFDSSTPCTSPDTFAVVTHSAKGWAITSDPDFSGGQDLEPAGTVGSTLYVNIPCSAMPGTIDTVTIYTTYVEDGAVLPEHVDCVDPNWIGTWSYYSSDVMFVEVIENPDPFHFVNNGIVEIPVGRRPCSVPFEIVKDDPCSQICIYEYEIVSTGVVGDPIAQTGTITVPWYEESGFAFAVLDSRLAHICDYDTLTMEAWIKGKPETKKTFKQGVHVTEITGDPDLPALPDQFELQGNVPNPFNPTTEIRYSLPEGSHVVVEIFDIRGTRIATIVNSYQEAGYKSVIWNGLSDTGSSVASGVYFCRVSACRKSDTRKIIMLR